VKQMQIMGTSVVATLYVFAETDRFPSHSRCRKAWGSPTSFGTFNFRYSILRAHYVRQVMFASIHDINAMQKAGVAGPRLWPFFV
jgi:hypothetical protein